MTANIRLVIAGSRKGFSKSQVVRWLDANIDPSTIECVISGAATSGPDLYGESWAEKHSLMLLRFPAKWNTPAGLDRGAGMKRNVVMADKCTMLVAFLNGNSSGTSHMIKSAISKGKHVLVVTKEELDKMYG